MTISANETSRYNMAKIVAFPVLGLVLLLFWIAVIRIVFGH